MEIIRDEKHYELRPAELEKAFAEQQRINRLADAQRHLESYYTEFYETEQKAADMMHRDFGCSLEEACDPCSAHYLLDQIVDSFENSFNSDASESKQYEYTIQDLRCHRLAGD